MCYGRRSIPMLSCAASFAARRADYDVRPATNILETDE